MKGDFLARLRRRRRLLIGALSMLLLALGLPTLDHALATAEPVAASDDPWRVPNPAAELWRAVRQGESARTQIGSADAGVLIQDAGGDWISRTAQLRQWAAWALVAVPAVLLVFFLLRGRVRIEDGPDGRTLPRWSLWGRLLHAFVALSFVVLAVTGFSLMYGRAVLIPWLGPQSYSAWAQIAKQAHNIVGPAFCVGVVLMIASWLHHNIPRWHDVVWFFRGGGMFGGRHPDAGMMNGGEKLWFWWIATVGLLACATGLVLEFPAQVMTQLGGGGELGMRQTMQLANILHAASAALWTLFFFGHAYIGTLGTEGAWQGMKTGRVDLNWARQHHNLWVEELEQRGVRPE